MLVIASPEYLRRAEGDASTDEGRRVQFEAALIRDEVIRPDAARDRFIPVLLPGQAANDFPAWLSPATGSHHRLTEFTVPGAESLQRLLTDRPRETTPDSGPVPGRAAGC